VTKHARSHLTLLSSPPVLITESADEFARFHDAVKREIAPQGAIEHFLVDDLAELMWGNSSLPPC